MQNFANPSAGVPELGFTHGGRFHADDVFSAALLRLLRPDIRIYRGFVVPKGFSGIVFDVGDGPFDHHTKNSPRRPNGTPYAAFGLLWREYGRWILPAEAAEKFDEKFISPLDLDDNIGTGNPVAALIAAFNPVWDAEEDLDAAFFEAVDVAQVLLYHRLKTILGVERGRSVVEQAYKQMRDGVVVLERFVPWKPVLVQTDTEFVIFPSPRGGYSVQCVPKEMSGKTGNKIPMPPQWRGKNVEDLRKISGIDDIKFCHSSGFMATTDSLEGALAVCRAAREEHLRRQREAAARKAQAAQSAPADGESEG